MSLFHRADPAADAGATFSLYHYDPTIAGGVVFALLYLATSGLHFWQLFRARCWFMIPLATGGIRERYLRFFREIWRKLTTILL
jgi:hypothetical protein